MRNLLIELTAAALALSLGGIASAADEDRDTPQPQAQQAPDPAAGGATVSVNEREYLVALNKCESLTGEEKTKCVDTARRKLGQM